MCEYCKYMIKNEIKIKGKLYDGCKKSRKDLPNDICNSKSNFCKSINDK